MIKIVQVMHLTNVKVTNCSFTSQLQYQACSVLHVILHLATPVIERFWSAQEDIYGQNVKEGQMFFLSSKNQKTTVCFFWQAFLRALFLFLLSFLYYNPIPFAFIGNKMNNIIMIVFKTKQNRKYLILYQENNT